MLSNEAETNSESSMSDNESAAALPAPSSALGQNGEPPLPGHDDPLLIKKKELHLSAVKHISNAVKADEENIIDKKTIIGLYRKGLQDLEDALAIDCWRGKSGILYERAKRLQYHMEKNLFMTLERVHALEWHEEEQRLGIDLSVMANNNDDQLARPTAYSMVPHLYTNKMAANFISKIRPPTPSTHGRNAALFMSGRNSTPLLRSTAKVTTNVASPTSAKLNF